MWKTTLSSKTVFDLTICHQIPKLNDRPREIDIIRLVYNSKLTQETLTIFYGGLYFGISFFGRRYNCTAPISFWEGQIMTVKLATVFFLYFLC